MYLYSILLRCGYCNLEFGPLWYYEAYINLTVYPVLFNYLYIIISSSSMIISIISTLAADS